MTIYREQLKSVSQDMLKELLVRANITISEFLLSKLPAAAIVRKQNPPPVKKLDQFHLRAKRLGVQIPGTNAAPILKAISSVEDSAVREALEIFLMKACQTPRYIVAGTVDTNQLSHWSLGASTYIHFTQPYTRYADIVAHRQLAVALDEVPWPEDLEALTKTVDLCNTKRDSAKTAQDQSIHLTLCALVEQLGRGESAVHRDALVINVMDSSFDVLLPDFGVEKRVHLDQLPLHKAEFDPKTRKLELFWLNPEEALKWQPSETSDREQTRAAGSMNFQHEAQSSLSREAEQTLKSGIKSAYAACVLSELMKECSLENKADVRHENGIQIQTITDLTRIKITLQADCQHKSPPLLLVKPVRP